MLVYHFVNARYGLDDLMNTRLKIARIMELNDPFEFLGVELSDRHFRRSLQAMKKELSTNRGILSFSKTWKNPVLWSHYADKHRGVCLGFEVPSSNLSKVKYVDYRFPRPKMPDEVFMEKLLTTKFKHWQYEREYRAFVALEENVDGLYYADFSKQLTLKRVIIGDRSRITRAQVSSALGDLEAQVKVFKARIAYKTFEVAENLNKALWR